jgi:hypothetical protein
MILLAVALLTGKFLFKILVHNMLKSRKSIIFLVLVITLFTMCNKGSIFQNINQKLSNDNKYWKLVSYKVNGIDSTELINFGNYPDFKDQFFQALLSSKTAGMPYCKNRLYVLGANFTNNNKTLTISNTHYVASSLSTACTTLNPQSCQRNVFLPEGNSTDWKIKKFRGGELILTCVQTNEYYIELKAGKNTN